MTNKFEIIESLKLVNLFLIWFSIDMKTNNDLKSNVCNKTLYIMG
jgi:hypothetical protein